MHARGEGLPPQTPQGPRGAWRRAQGKAACAQIVLKALVQLLLAARERRRRLCGPLLLWDFETRLPTLPPRTAQPPLLWGLLRLPWPAPSAPHFPPGIQGLSRWLPPYGHHCTPMLHMRLSSFHLVPLLFSRGGRPIPTLLSKLNTLRCSSRTTVAHIASPCLEIPSQELSAPFLSSLAHPRSLSVSLIQQTPTEQKVTSSQPL